MENENVNNSNLAEAQRMISDFQKKQTQSTKKKSKEDILAKYFVPRKNKEIFRILPPKPGKKHIEEAFFHVVTTNAKGGVKKHGTVIYCPAHNDPKVKKLDVNGNPMMDAAGNQMYMPAPCPLCAKHKKELAKQDLSLKGIKKENMNDAQLKIKAKNDEIYKEAIKWEAKKFYIIRGIDKGAEKDGVKLWRFKHNYKNQGTLDKLLPILEDYMSSQKADFSDINNGTDLNINMADTEFQGRIYKSITAINYRGKSPLHTDSLISRAWLDDDTTWRDVFLPKRAPNTTPYEFLEMIAMGTSPYWEDSDPQKKHWVFPGRPDLEQLANTRTANLENEEENYEYASDLDDEDYPRVTISNITESKVGTYSESAIDVAKEVTTQMSAEPQANEPTSSKPDYDDLPF